MGPAFYVMAILGCGEADSACEPVKTVNVQYQSQEACNAATEQAIAENSDILYPVVVAQCRPATSNVAEKVWADEVKLPGNGKAPVRRAAYQPPKSART